MYRWMLVFSIILLAAYSLTEMCTHFQLIQLAVSGLIAYNIDQIIYKIYVCTSKLLYKYLCICFFSTLTIRYLNYFLSRSVKKVMLSLVENVYFFLHSKLQINFI